MIHHIIGVVRRRWRTLLTVVSGVAVAVALCYGAWLTAHADPNIADGEIPVVKPSVLGEIPHDTSAFTQGLELDGNSLYEGTGKVGSSQMRELDPDGGAVRRAITIPTDYFGEGITVVDDRIWQLTWRDGVAIEWDKATLSPLREVAFDGEGWGLCRDGDRLIRSDGTDRLRFHEAIDFAETGAVNVTRNGQPLMHLNELECVDGQVWANIWLTDEIVRIDPATGTVTAVVDATAIATGQGQNADAVLNGIAHIDGDQFLLTGKNWPTIFRVRIATKS